MERLGIVALVVVLGAVCLSTGIVAAVTPDPFESNWWADWAVLSGAALAIIGAIGLYRGRADVAHKARAASWAEARQKTTTFLQGIGQAVLTVIILGICINAGGYVAVWLWPGSTLANNWRYSLEDDLNGATIVVDPMPHNCEFLTAPIGAKHCHYDRRVLTIRIRTSTSVGRLASYDDGKTWQKADPSLKRAVFVSWEKIAD
jgi:hypothetical protein